MIPEQFKYLIGATSTKMVVEGVKVALKNIKEVPGKGSSPDILHMADFLGIANIYKNDDTPWCSVSHAYVAKMAGKIVPFTGYDLLRAIIWMDWGIKIKTSDAAYGDTCIYQRPGGNHVGIYIAEDPAHIWTMGGNQSNTYNIVPIEKQRLIGVRRPVYQSGTPETVQKVFVSTKGVLISKNEA